MFGAIFHGGRTFNFSISGRTRDTQVKFSVLMCATVEGKCNADMLDVIYYSCVLALGNLAIVKASKPSFQ
jgi:hypothetical protein